MGPPLFWQLVTGSVFEMVFLVPCTQHWLAFFVGAHRILCDVNSSEISSIEYSVCTVAAYIDFGFWLRCRENSWAIVLAWPLFHRMMTFTYPADKGRFYFVSFLLLGNTNDGLSTNLHSYNGLYFVLHGHVEEIFGMPVFYLLFR